MKKILKKIVRFIAFKYGKPRFLYIKICGPSSIEHADFLRLHGGFFSIGELTAVNISANIPDPSYVRIGRNCTLSACTLLGHDGVVRILNNQYGTKLDSVGSIDIRDNCFVGHGSIVMPNVVIGPNSIVAAGSVVTKNVPPGAIVGGNPAKIIGNTTDLVKRLQDRTNAYPWHQLIEKREDPFDREIEPILREMRIKYFYGEDAAPSSSS